jgi:FkbM family methyltransferase
MNSIEIDACHRAIKLEVEQKNPNNPLLQGWKSFSQCDEDGIIRECIKRIQRNTELSGTFIEIGCGDGLENNTHQLLIDGFTGVWCDADGSNIESISNACGGLIFGNLLVEQSFITLASVAAFCDKATRFLGTKSVDFLSLDIDGNDIHILPHLITNIAPKLICIEYNAKFRPGSSVSMDYQESFTWNKDDYFGASLQAFNDIIEPFGYNLVCCNAAGTNAFYVYRDYTNHFQLSSIEDLYMPPRYYLCLGDKGHPSSLSWLRQSVNRIPINNTYNLKPRPRIYAQTNYGGLLTYADDMVIGSSLRESGEFQEKEIKDVVDYLKSAHNFHPKHFVDIGANIGTHSIYAVKNHLFEQAWCYEVERSNFNLLSANIAINKLAGKIECFHTGISDRTGTTTIELSDQNFGDHRIASENTDVEVCGESKWINSTATLTTLDDALKSINASAEDILIWIDTQGHEGHVFAGGSSFWATPGRKFVVCEYWPYGLERAGGAELFFAFLNSCKYILNIGDRLWTRGATTSLQELRESYPRMLKETRSDYHPHTNLLLVI